MREIKDIPDDILEMMSIREIARRRGVDQATLRGWKKKFNLTKVQMATFEPPPKLPTLHQLCRQHDKNYNTARYEITCHGKGVCEALGIPKDENLERLKESLDKTAFTDKRDLKFDHYLANKWSRRPIV